MTMKPSIHASAEVDPDVTIGAGSAVWHFAQVRAAATIGRQCVIGSHAYIDAGVRIGDWCKIQNGAMIFSPAELDQGVFIGPGACLTNDLVPRAMTPDEAGPKAATDWEAAGVRIRRGASLGARCVVLPGIRIGEYAMIGAGAVVTHDVDPHTIVVGNPARVVGHVCKCGTKLDAGAACAVCGYTW